jgi:hypothetical protein
MTQLTPAPERPPRRRPRPSEPPEPPEPPNGGLKVFLWTTAALIALLEFTWWWAERIYSP